MVRAEATAEKTKHQRPASPSQAPGCQRLFIRQDWVAGARLRSQSRASVGAGRKQGLQGGGSGVILTEFTCLSQACAGQGGAKPPNSQGRPPSPGAAPATLRNSQVCSTHISSGARTSCLIPHPPAAAREIRDDRSSEFEPAEAIFPCMCCFVSK